MSHASHFVSILHSFGSLPMNEVLVVGCPSRLLPMVRCQASIEEHLTPRGTFPCHKTDTELEKNRARGSSGTQWDSYERDLIYANKKP